MARTFIANVKGDSLYSLSRQYAKSSSNTTPPTTFSDTPVELTVAEPYQWTRWKVVIKNHGSNTEATSYTDALLDGVSASLEEFYVNGIDYTLTIAEYNEIMGLL